MRILTEEAKRDDLFKDRQCVCDCVCMYVCVCVCFGAGERWEGKESCNQLH